MATDVGGGVGSLTMSEGGRGAASTALGWAVEWGLTLLSGRQAGRQAVVLGGPGVCGAANHLPEKPLTLH